MSEYTEKSVQIVEQWGKSIGCQNGKSCVDCRREYWLTEATDND